MKISAMIDLIVTAIDTDSALISYCTSTFGKRHKIFVGMNLRVPPSETDMPCIVVDSIYERVVDANRNSVKILLGLLSSSETKTTTGYVTRLVGFTQSEEFRDQATAALIRAQKKFKSKINFDQGETVSNEVFPIFSSKISINLEYPVTENSRI